MELMDRIIVGMENAVAYGLMSVFNGGYRYSEICNGRLEEEFRHVEVPVSRYDEFLEDSRMRHEDQCRRRALVEGKARVLMAAGLMLAGLSLAVGLACGAWWALAPLMLSVGSVLMCLFAERPRSYYVPSNLELMEKHLGDDYKEAVMSGWQGGLHFNDCGIDLVTGAYCTARRMAVLGLLAFVASVIAVAVL